MSDRPLSGAYVDLLLRIVKWQQQLDIPSTDADRVIKVQEEVGELAEAYSIFRGTNPRKGHDPAAWPLVQEAADVILTAAVTIVGLGFDPNDALEAQAQKTLDRFVELGQGD